MLVIRPIDYHDLPALERLAVVSGGSLTTLPAHREHLNDLIGATRQSLRAEDEAHPRSFHFVLENTESRELLGISGIETRIGVTSPFYSYRMAEFTHTSKQLQIRNTVGTLSICQDLAGSSRLCTLFLAPEHRNALNHQLLSRARLLFMALHRSLLAKRCIAELQGVLDEEGKSPFWESLGRHFFSMELSRATFLAGINFKGFIASLMPQQPIYIPLLGKTAQDSLGKPRSDIASNKQLLEMEGFSFSDHIDIFDGGPTLEIDTDQIATFQQIRRTTASVGRHGSDERVPSLVSNCGFSDYRCLIATLSPLAPQLTTEQMAALNIGPDDPIQITPCHSLAAATKTN
ncbi:arginine N-succinyltransferase [Aestuariirhabdus litorea]|uniref:Arginine N-succinyltransferase n=1 Tax=Aestuariirhabdus litorea TaxID=2528527 RepID=A0A3P3VRN9_9GAMM|nr:arginine N-succinyltransferase [Aestuariirhabdus litorea]RRJ84967.1 arginine N-succinyltransferase [Aestuariirhabdus litorea]RWW98191.1 arginine N-succinyltransferase [Endozoicomonadaceae bacterium GTF-13]